MNVRHILPLLLLTVLCFTASAHAIELVPHQATYTAKIKKGISIKGNAVRELKQLDNGQWLYRFDVESFIADIDESAILAWQDDQVIPYTYNYKLSAFLAKDRKRQVLFDWDKKRATNPLKKKGWIIDSIPKNTLDRLSYQLQLGMDLQAGKQEMVYQIAHKGSLRESRFKVTGEETIQTKLGSVDSILVKKIRDKSSKRKTSLWFSKKHPLLLLRMTQIEKDGEEYEINLQQATIGGVAVTL